MNTFESGLLLFKIFSEALALITKIGVLSDTHLENLSQGGEFLEEVYQTYFHDVSMILHAGDLTNSDILMVFDPVPVYAVRGNMDPYVAGIPGKRVVEVQGVRLGLIHGWGAPEGLEERVLNEFSGQHIDVLVYGHSHEAVCHWNNGILFFNPGSPVDKRNALHCTVGLLEIDQSIRGHILNVDSLRDSHF